MVSNKQIFRECGGGWEQLILPILEEADAASATITQVKEKFGCLRVYFDPGQADCDKLEDLIDAAELASAATCEMCGGVGCRMSKGGWMKTLCKEHAIELSYKGKAA